MKLKFAYILLVLFFFNTDLRSQWILLQNFDTGSISDIEVHNNFLFAANGDSGVFRSPDNGENWTSVNSGFSTTYVTGLTVSNFGIFASTVSGVFSSTNNGNNWNATGSGISGGYIRKITSVDNDIYAGHILAGVFKTTNNGVNWQRFALGEGDKMFAIYGTQSEFYISVANTILRTTDNGLTFSNAINGLTNLFVMTLSSFEGDLYAGSRGGIFHSTDIGSNWTRVTYGLDDSVFNVIINKGENVFAGSQSRGLFLSTNRGKSWISVNTGLTDIDITSIAVTQGYIFAGTSNGNIWRRPLNEIPLSIRKNKLNISEDIILKGNYPNPFNPVTKIKYELRVANYVTVTVYDVSGNKVETLVNQKQNAGSYEVEFDARLSPPSQSRERGSDLSSGVYFYKVESGDFAEVKRMVLLK